LEKPFLRQSEDNGLQNHASCMLIDRINHRIRIVILKGAGQIAHCRRNAVAPLGNTDIPVVPAMVSATQYPLSVGVGPSKPHCGAGHVAAGFAEPDHISARNTVADQLGYLYLERMHKREGDTTCQLLSYRIIDGRVLVS